jgi:uncharacterized membrane protein
LNPGAASDLQKESHLRSLIKGITWRMVGTIDTFVLSYIFTGSVKIAAAIGGTEVITKVILFYIHDRVWQWIPRENFLQKWRKGS